MSSRGFTASTTQPLSHVEKMASCQSRERKGRSGLLALITSIRPQVDCPITKQAPIPFVFPAAPHWSQRSAAPTNYKVRPPLRLPDPPLRRTVEEELRDLDYGSVTTSLSTESAPTLPEAQTSETISPSTDSQDAFDSTSPRFSGIPTRPTPSRVRARHSSDPGRASTSAVGGTSPQYHRPTQPLADDTIEDFNPFAFSRQRSESFASTSSYAESLSSIATGSTVTHPESDF
ncbi:hypothetical protein P7C70_g4156, partial [Phenoliferia sp. Uapishka_3]